MNVPMVWKLWGVIVTALLSGAISAHGAQTPANWSAVTLPSPRDVEMGGTPGNDLRRGIERLAMPPYDARWLLADLSFKANRSYTNYSGDVSGRFLELAALTSPRDQFVPPVLKEVLDQALQYQKADGHFGADIDLKKTFGSSPQATAAGPMFWGNARILVGLIAVAGERNRPDFLDAAKRLGDFYAATADTMCDPSREKEFRATGTYGAGYVCCYFPAIEGLVLLHRATGDERYLSQARRMAELFRQYDVLPVDHSHGNLCAWRGILMLYETTGDRAYLETAQAKWEAAVKGGFVWPIGGVGEHWHVTYQATEGCSDSDWLRFNLELWRHTGDSRYIKMAERVLDNQYRSNQCPNGGFGTRKLESDAAGPFAVMTKVSEWDYCCSFHGPLGLNYLKSYLAAGSDRGVFVNFLLDFAAPVKTGTREGRITVKTEAVAKTGLQRAELELCPADESTPWHTVLHIHSPVGASIEEIRAGGQSLQTAVENGFIRIEREFKRGDKVVITLHQDLRIEGRRFQPIQPESGKLTRLRDVAILSGSRVLFVAPVPGPGRPALLATVNAQGKIELPVRIESGPVSVALPSADAGEKQIAAALASGPIVPLRAWGTFDATQKAWFMVDLVVVPKTSLDAKSIEGLAGRARADEFTWGGPAFGEKRR